ncbi:unnamed protein product [Medioppia subpectinata]|uniref:Cytochrome b-c1 complex subunit 10 n=1 Tax=Medioppia subpectinata TaxID=1979941 RepID=A0A7R9KJH9_9ACAR|nr:unnamed protein product [Medioppia subpectinata]CAG2103323.1 unnamed protein product [Medioppia subpectinata]
MSHGMKGVWPQLTPRRAINWSLNWGRSGVGYGAAAAVAVAFAFDWKYVLQYVPIINTQWSDDKPAKK